MAQTLELNIYILPKTQVELCSKQLLKDEGEPSAQSRDGQQSFSPVSEASEELPNGETYSVHPSAHPQNSRRKIQKEEKSSSLS